MNEPSLRFNPLGPALRQALDALGVICKLREALGPLPKAPDGGDLFGSVRNMDVSVAGYMDVLAPVPKRFPPSGADDCTDPYSLPPFQVHDADREIPIFIGMTSLLPLLRFRFHSAAAVPLTLLQRCASYSGTALPAHAFPCILTDVRTTTVCK